MTWLWTWGGRSFGYREEDELFTHDGQHIGHFIEEEVYGPDGAYLGEVHQERLIRNKSKAAKRSPSWAPSASRAAIVNYVGYVGYVMIAGYEDFPKLEG